MPLQLCFSRTHSCWNSSTVRLPLMALTNLVKLPWTPRTRVRFEDGEIISPQTSCAARFSRKTTTLVPL